MSDCSQPYIAHLLCSSLCFLLQLVMLSVTWSSCYNLSLSISCHSLCSLLLHMLSSFSSSKFFVYFLFFSLSSPFHVLLSYFSLSSSLPTSLCRLLQSFLVPSVLSLSFVFFPTLLSCCISLFILHAFMFVEVSRVCFFLMLLLLLHFHSSSFPSSVVQPVLFVVVFPSLVCSLHHGACHFPSFHLNFFLVACSPTSLVSIIFPRFSLASALCLPGDRDCGCKQRPPHCLP